MKCFYHPDRDAIGVCLNCGRSVCPECQVVLSNKLYCKPCADKVFSSRVGAPTRTESIGTVIENTSGQGNLAVIPPEIRGWNWGAFFLGIIWGIGNNVWIALLELIPFVGWVMIIVLGIKGNEWAWRNKRWNSVEHFKKTQRTWAKWGLAVFVVAFLVGLIIGVAEEFSTVSW